MFVLNAPFNSIISDYQPTTQLYTPDSPDPQYQTVPLDFERPEGSILWTWNVLGGFPCERKQLGNLTHSKTNMTYFSLNFSSKTFVQLYSPTQTSSLITDLYPNGFFVVSQKLQRVSKLHFHLTSYTFQSVPCENVLISESYLLKRWLLTLILVLALKSSGSSMTGTGTWLRSLICRKKRGNH